MLEETFQLYVSELCDLPADLLKLAVHEHIQKSAWFPRVSDLRQIVQREIGAGKFDGVSGPLASLPDSRELYAAERDLMAAFASGEDLDKDAWFLLIAGFEAIGFEQSAHRNRQRYAHFKKIIDSENENLPQNR